MIAVFETVPAEPLINAQCGKTLGIWEEGLLLMTSISSKPPR